MFLKMFSVDIFLFIFSIFLVISALMVILSKHPVFSLLFLLASFVFSSFILFILECELLALLFIIVYVGAIAILFLFAVMMLESKALNLAKNSTKYFPIGIVFSVIVLTPFLLKISQNFPKFSDLDNYNIYINWYDLIDSISDVETYGQVLYSYYVLQFLISGIILLMILVGVVYLTNEVNSNKTIDQSLFKQLSRNSKLFY
uniref:NADH dehydrogenase subunit 6 n=1 Tax=Cocconeiopsis kantsiensis TaxID=3082010 RepID=UPI0030025976